MIPKKKVWEDGEFEQREAYLKRLADDFASEDDYDKEDEEPEYWFDDQYDEFYEDYED